MSHRSLACRICRRLARIVGGTAECMDGVCVVSFQRSNLAVTVLGEPTRSPLVFAGEFSVENLDERGRALCIGEIVLLQEEVNRFISALRRHGIIVTALHNHWMFESPRLMYLHWEQIINPVRFARAVAEALETLKVPVPALRQHHSTSSDES